MGLKTFLRKQAAKYLIREQNKPVQLSDLVFVGVDSNGVKYYTWERLEDMPRTRYLEIEKINIFIDNKLSPQNLKEIAGAILELNTYLIKEKDQQKRSMIHAQISALANELTFREQYAIPSEVLTALASAITIREDEQPSIWSDRIQTEKSETFTREMMAGNYFFLTTKIFKTLIPSLAMSASEWLIQFGKLQRQLKHQGERLATILSKNESEHLGKVKTP